MFLGTDAGRFGSKSSTSAFRTDVVALDPST